MTHLLYKQHWYLADNTSWLQIFQTEGRKMPTKISTILSIRCTIVIREVWHFENCYQTSMLGELGQFPQKGSLADETSKNAFGLSWAISK